MPEESHAHESLLHRMLERITGCHFPDPLDPREWECNPLRVVRDDEEIIFQGNVMVAFAPDEVDQGWADVLVDDPPPRIHVNRHEEIWGPPSVYLGDPFVAGLALIGADAEGTEYVWLINRAAEFANLDELWTRQDLP
ncbi:MAG: hypothetical protein ACHQ50_04665 [Fimbriimonadales bacterium]